jgi:ubiquinone/menaquinone biosynthesis C-methylase UbiE
MIKPEKIQEDYYKKTAQNYEPTHCCGSDLEHEMALHQLLGMIDYLNITSILDVGSGTGRVINFFNNKKTGIKIIGIEPVQKLRDIGYNSGISKNQLINGDGLNIDYPDNSFDLVCEFGVLHHVKNHKQMVDEMLRVSKKAIFISDNNNFGAGSFGSRSVKQILNFLNLWNLYNFIRTKGKMYMISEGDGLFYSYSVFNNYSQIKKKCKSVHLFNTINADKNIYRTSSHLTLLGIK